MKDTVDFLTVGLVTSDPTPINSDILSASVFFSKAFALDVSRVMVELSEDSSRSPSLGELWNDLSPNNGTFTFEIATEFPFSLPNLNNHPEYQIQVGDQQLIVCNRMVRAFFTRGYPNDSGLGYYLVHNTFLPNIAKNKHLIAGIHPLPLRSFVSHRITVSAERTEQAIKSGFLLWRKQLIDTLSKLVIAMREIAPKKLNNVLPHSSIGGFPIFWLAVIASGDRCACEQFMGDLLAAPLKPFINLTAEENIQLKERLATSSSSSSRQAIGLAEAFCYYGYYELAIVQLSVACEIILYDLLSHSLINIGVSNSKLKEHLENITFSQLINIILPLLKDLSSLPNKGCILGDINWIRKTRNDIVHLGRPRENLTEKRTLKALDSVLKFTTFLQPI